MASIELSVDEPDLLAAACLFIAVVLIDVSAIAGRRATISRWGRHQIRRHPYTALGCALAFGAHLTVDAPADPFRLIAGWIGRHVTITTEEA